MDFSKGILISLVVIGHLIQYGIEDYKYIYLYQCIYSFHMPLFFLFSGMAFHHSSKKYSQSSVEMTMRNFKNLVIPYFIWSFLFLLLIEKNRTLEEIITNPFAFFWYLEVLFFCLTIVSIVVQKNSKISIIKMLFIFCAYELAYFMATGNVHLKYSAYYLPYIIIGYAISRYDLPRKLQYYTLECQLPLRILIAAISFVLLIKLFELYNFNFDNILQAGLESRTVKTVISYFMRLSVVISALLVLFTLNCTIYYKHINTVVMLGMFSLEIYIIHLFVIRALAIIELNFFLLSVLSTILTYLIILIFNILIMMPVSMGIYRILFGRIPIVSHYRN